MDGGPKEKERKRKLATNSKGNVGNLWLKEVSEFVEKIHVCDIDIIQLEDFIKYYSLVQEATREHWNQPEPADGKEKSQEQTYLPKAYTL